MTNQGNQDKKQGTLEEVQARGGQLVEKVRKILEEGNARRIIIKKDGRSVAEFPLSVGVGGATAVIFLHPILAAIGSFVSLASDVRILVERAPESAGKSSEKTSTERPQTTT